MSKYYFDDCIDNRLGSCQEGSTLEISLTGISKEFKNLYDELAKKNNMSHADFAKVLVENYEKFNIEFTEEENEKVTEAISLAPKSYFKKLKRSALKHASDISDFKDDIIVDEKISNSPKSADKRADDALEMLFKNNDEATNKNDKIFISRKGFIDFMSKLKAAGDIELVSSQIVTTRCLERRKELIAAHHAEHGLDENHNVKAHQELKKLTKKGEK